MRGLTTRIAATIAACALMLLAAGAEAKALTAEIIEWGITDIERRPSPPERSGTGLSPSYDMWNVRYILQTDEIEIRQCRNFGVTVKFSEQPTPGRVEIRLDHPLFTRPDGATSTQDVYHSDVMGGVTRVGFTFDHVWEMRAGDWTFVILADGAEIARKTFTVTLPFSGVPRSECGVVS